MLRILFIIILSLSGTLSGILLHKKFPLEDTNEKKENISTTNREQEFVSTEMLAQTIINENKINGYIVSRFVLSIEKDFKDINDMDDGTIIADSFYESIFNSKIYLFNKTNIPNMSLYADKILNKANEKFGQKRFKGILIQQVDLFGSSDVRKQIIEERPSIK